MAKAKQDAIIAYVESHVHDEISTSALATATGVSLPTILAFIKNNSQYFTKIKHGVYRIEAVLQNDDASSNVVTTVIATVVHNEPQGPVDSGNLAASANGPAGPAIVYPSDDANAAIAAAVQTFVVSPTPVAESSATADDMPTATQESIARPFEW